MTDHLPYTYTDPDDENPLCLAMSPTPDAHVPYGCEGAAGHEGEHHALRGAVTWEDDPDDESVRSYSTDTAPLPRRDDQVATWLKARRHAATNPTALRIIENLLDDYRLHADTGTPLDQHACETRNCDQCPTGTTP